MDDLYLHDVHDYTSSLNSSTTNIDTTDSHAKRNDLLQRPTELSNDGGISISSNRDPEPAGGGEPSRPSTRSRTVSSTAKQFTASNRMSTGAISGGDVAPVDTGGFYDTQLNEVRRLGLLANIASQDCLHSQSIVSFIGHALVTGNPIKQGLPGGDETIVVPNKCEEADDLPQAQE